MRKLQRRALAGVLAFAMVCSVAGVPNVASAASKKIKVSTKKVTLKVGKSKKVKVKNAPKKAKITWSSKNKKIAKVNKKGKITGVKEGNTKVICKLSYKKGSKKKTKKFTIKVKVNPAEAAEPTVAPTTAVPATPTTGAAVQSSDAPASPSTEPTAEPTITPTVPPVLTADYNDLTAPELIEEMGNGINLGNTLDGHNNYAVGETAWQKVITTKSLIKYQHDIGYNTIRIPVTWGNMIDDNDQYKIDEIWMSRVQDVVDYAMAENMYVIINIHHDGAYNGEGQAHGWLDIGGTEEEFAQVQEKFLAVWTQIADRFKDYDEHLIFESMNEVSAETSDVNNELVRINHLNQIFVDLIRQSGSNNAVRWLSVPTLNTRIDTLISDEYTYQVPNDPSSHVMVAAHIYEAWGYSSTNEEKEMSYAYQFKALKEKYVDNGIPVFIGEWGTLGSLNDTLTLKYESVPFLLKKYNIVGALWDIGDVGMIDRENESLRWPSLNNAVARGFFQDTEVPAYTLDGSVPELVPLTGFDVDKESVELVAGETAKIEVSNRQPEESDEAIFWKSEDGEIASVYNGKIVARAVGTTTITAYAMEGEVEKNIEVTVTPQELEEPSTKITTGQNEYTVELEDKAYLDAKVTPVENGAWINYKSSNESVVTVSTKGKLVAIATGSAVVTATTSDGLAKEIPVSIVEPAAPDEFIIDLALHVLYNDSANSYWSTELSDPITVNADGTYTLTFDCATQLSSAALDAGVTNLNGLGALYIKDYKVTNGDEKRSPNVEGKIRYTSIKVNDMEMPIESNVKFDVLKGGVFDTGNPLNAWDGSVITSGIELRDTAIYFQDIENPTKIEVTFELSGFTS